MRLEVVVPAGVRSGSPVGRDDHVRAVVLAAARERRDALDTGPGADVVQEQDRPVPGGTPDPTLIRAELFDDPPVEGAHSRPALACTGSATAAVEPARR